MTTWTNEQRMAFNALCHTPLMQEALSELENRCKVTLLPVAQGHDALVMAAAEFHRRLGQAEVLKFIAEMCQELRTQRQLPEPNTEEALRKT